MDVLKDTCMILHFQMKFYRKRKKKTFNENIFLKNNSNFELEYYKIGEMLAQSVFFTDK